MLSFLLSNCNYSARFSFFSSFCNFLLCYRFVYIPAGIYAKKKSPNPGADSGSLGKSARAVQSRLPKIRSR